MAQRRQNNRCIIDIGEAIPVRKEEAMTDKTRKPVQPSTDDDQTDESTDNR